MTEINDDIYKTPLRNLTKEKLLKLKNFMNFEDYLEQNFKHIHKYDSELYIISTDDTPKFTYYDTSGYDIFNATKIWVDKLLIEPNKRNLSFNNLLNNYVIAYGEYNFLKEKKKELLLIFNKILIPIYDTDYLYFNYNNSYILYPDFYETNWRPIDNNEYNQIIENIMFFIFDILVILYPNIWSYLKNDFLYNHIYRDINSDLYIINSDKLDRKEIIKTYLYQTWLILMHDNNLIDFFNQIDSDSKSETTIKYPNISIHNNNKYWTNNRHNIVIFLNKYIINDLSELSTQKYIINNEDYNKINIIDEEKNKIFFNYNILNTNETSNKTIIIISFIAIFIIFITIIIYLWFRKTYNKTYEDPFRIIIGNN